MRHQGKVYSVSKDSSRRGSDDFISKISTSCDSPENSFTSDDKKPLRLMSEKFDNENNENKAFRKKIKTELCKNWELTGNCPFKSKVTYFIKVFICSWSRRYLI